MPEISPVSNRGTFEKEDNNTQNTADIPVSDMIFKSGFCAFIENDLP